MARARRGKSAKSKAARATARRSGKLRVLVVEARFYDDIADALLKGATGVLKQAGASFDVITVPGSLEIPSAITMALDAAENRDRPYDGVVALGCVIRGETFHFEIVATESARALMDLSTVYRIPLGNGVLTVDTEAQAWARASGEENKGADAARAALVMIKLKRDLSA